VRIIMKKEIMRKGELPLLLILITGSALALNGGRLWQASEEKKAVGKWYKELIALYPKDLNYRKLTLQSYFPLEADEEKEVFLRQARYMACDSESNIFVSDSQECTIWKFDVKGKFIKKMGRRGQGPGELLAPEEIMICSNSIVVHDRNNRRVHYFDLEGKFLKSFITPEWYLALDMTGDERFYGARLRIKPDDPLIDVLNNRGDILFSFGKGKEYSDRHLDQIDIAILDGGRIAVAFKLLPIIQIYSSEGRLIKEMELNYPILKKYKEWNLDVKKPASKHQGYVSIFWRIRKTKHGFAVLRSWPRMDIFEFDREGNPLNAFWFRSEADWCRADDFVDIDLNGRRYWFVLQFNPENRVDIFRPTNVIDQ
jgi:hypothetical protein